MSKKKKRSKLLSIIRGSTFVYLFLAVIIITIVIYGKVTEPDRKNSALSILSFFGPVAIVEVEIAVLYDAPNTNASPIVEIEHGWEFPINGSACGWYMVSYYTEDNGSQDFWINGNDVRVEYSDHPRESIEEIEYDCDTFD